MKTQSNPVYPVVRDHWGVFPLSELADRAAEKYQDAVFTRTWNGADYDEVTFNEFAVRVKAVGRWLIDQGIKPGDRAAVWGDDSVVWGIAYLGIQVAGAVVVPVDRLISPSGMRHIIADSEAKVLFTSAQYLEQFEEVEPIRCLDKIISFDSSGENVISWNEALEAGAKSSAIVPERTLDELAGILYTSGTTGQSKGVMLSQMNIASNVAACMQMTDLGPDDVFLAVLPMHHIYQCTAGFLHPLYIGSSITFARRLRSAEMIMDIKATKVTIMGAVPLLFEKMEQGIRREVKKKGKAAETVFNTMMKISALGEKRGLNPGKKLFRSIREKGGVGTVRMYITAGAAINPETCKFFNRFGIVMLQGYGITETSPLCHLTPAPNTRYECTGLPIPELECKISRPDEDGVGEVLVKGPNVFLGYYRNEQATKEAFDENGFFRTGDLGIIHSDGYLQITGRKKNLIVTAGGKNVFPEEIEHHLNSSPYIAESLVLGLKRKSGYGEDAGVLIHPDYEQVDLYFESMGKEAGEDDLRTLIKEEIMTTMKDLQSYKQIRSFRIFEEEFQKTSTKKIKRFLYSGDMVEV